MFQCLECGRDFRSTRAAEKASAVGCPDCGGVDIDLAVCGPVNPETGLTESEFTEMITDDSTRKDDPECTRIF